MLKTIQKLFKKPEWSEVHIDHPKLAEGDGNAVFFTEGTQKEFAEMEKEDKGLKGIFQS